jgi:hypothetical protein
VLSGLEKISHCRFGLSKFSAKASAIALFFAAAARYCSA